MNRVIFVAFLAAAYVGLDIYVHQAIRAVMADYSVTTRRVVTVVYFLVSLVIFAGIILYNQVDPKAYKNLRMFISTSFFVVLVGKLLIAIFLLADDLRRMVTYLINLLPAREEAPRDLGRSRFMAKSALIAGAVPVAVFSFGIISGAHDYRVRKRQVVSGALPKSFDGMRVVQISDIHTGSFFSKTAVSGGVDLINAQKPDIVFFTGDLVNNHSSEAKPYLDIFGRIKAEMGVYSTMGNHDYGDYNDWPSRAAKQADVEALHAMHRYMGWDILLNENRIIRSGHDELAILGIF